MKLALSCDTLCDTVVIHFDLTRVNKIRIFSNIRRYGGFGGEGGTRTYDIKSLIFRTFVIHL